jgi:hypothetical protein
MPKSVISDPTRIMIARASLAEAEGDVLRATDIMVERVMSDARLYKILTDPLVKTACYDAIKIQCGRQSRRIWESFQPSADAFRERVKALGRVIASDFDLPGSRKLDDTMRGEVAAEIEKQADDTTVRQPPKKKVRRITRSKSGQALPRGR